MSTICSMANKTELAVPTYLKNWRKFRKMTQEELAAKVQMSPPSISQLERGLQGFSDKSLAQLAVALDCTPGALLVHDPLRRDSFWPLCEMAEKLGGDDRRRLFRILTAAFPNGAGSE